jgi:hypothetical protein
MQYILAPVIFIDFASTSSVLATGDRRPAFVFIPDGGDR